MKKLLFVCMGNICRSPAAEGAMRSLVDKEGLASQIICDSAGTIGYHVGAPPDHRMTEHALNRGLKLQHAARKFIKADFERFDYILAMDKSNYRDILSLDLEGKYSQKVFMMTDFCRSIKADEVPDPYYGGATGFELVLDIVCDGAQGLLEKVKKEL